MKVTTTGVLYATSCGLGMVGAALVGVAVEVPGATVIGSLGAAVALLVLAAMRTPSPVVEEAATMVFCTRKVPGGRCARIVPLGSVVWVDNQPVCRACADARPWPATGVEGRA